MKNSFKKSIIAIIIILTISMTGCAQLSSLTKHIFSKTSSEEQPELAGSTLTVETNSAQAGTVQPETEPAPETEIKDAENAETESEAVENEDADAEETSTEASDDDAQTSSGEVTYTETNETVYTTTDLNARNSPGPDGEVAKTVPAGTKLTRIAVGSDGWDKVDYNGQLYYMSHDYLSTQAP